MSGTPPLAELSQLANMAGRLGWRLEGDGDGYFVDGAGDKHTWAELRLRMRQEFERLPTADELSQIIALMTSGHASRSSVDLSARRRFVIASACVHMMGAANVRVKA